MQSPIPPRQSANCIAEVNPNDAQLQPDMLTAALEYAARGWLVLPLHTPQPDGCSCRKRAACTATGKHPRTQSGLSAATTDEEQIRSWWRRWPYANIGILTGNESRLMVLDVDDREGRHGIDALASLSAEFEPMPETLTAKTGSGIHLYFHSPSIPARNSINKVADGIDVRADRAYVVAPPSLHSNGKRYAWIRPLNSIQDAPDWLLAKMTANRGEVMTIPVEDGDIFPGHRTVNEGNRNETLFKLGCIMRGRYAKERSDIVAVLFQCNRNMCKPPLEETEVIAIADSACQYPPEKGASKSGKRLEQSPLYWYKQNTRAFFSDPRVAQMSDSQLAWYFRLKAYAWDGGGLLPGSYDALWKLAKAKSRRVFEQAAELVLAEYEDVLVDGVRMWRHPVLAAEYATALANCMDRMRRGQNSQAKQRATRGAGVLANEDAE